MSSTHKQKNVSSKMFNQRIEHGIGTYNHQWGTQEPKNTEPGIKFHSK